MRKGAVSLVALLVAGAVTMVTRAAPTAGASSSASIKIPLPAPGQAKVSRITVQLATPNAPVGSLKVVATNATALGGRQLNSQVVFAVARTKPTNTSSTTFEVWVFIHRYPPVPSATRMLRSAAPESFAYLAFEG